MRIGITARGSTPDEVVQHAREAERDGFSSVWYSHLLMGDPLAVMVLAGRATSSIELGTAVLQTYPCHPLLQANRTSATATAMGRAGLTVGLGPSHKHIVEDVYGLSYDHPGRSTEDYLRIYTGLMRGEEVEYDGQDWSVHSAKRMVAPSCRGTGVAGCPVTEAVARRRPIRRRDNHVDGTGGRHRVPRGTDDSKGCRRRWTTRPSDRGWTARCRPSRRRRGASRCRSVSRAVRPGSELPQNHGTRSRFECGRGIDRR